MLAGVLRHALSVNVSAALAKDYLERMAEDCGVSGDPLGRSLVEELAMLKVVAANLHSQTLICKKPADVAAINSAACAVAAEMRRTAIGLKEFRKKSDSSRRKRDAKAEESMTDEAPAVHKPDSAAA